MLPKLIFLAIAVPIVELALLFYLSTLIGFWLTIGIVILTGFLGAILWRLQGLGVVGRLRESMIKRSSPGDALMDGALIFFSGGLLLTPGVLTDLFGFALLIPWTRSVFKKMMFRWISANIKMVPMPGDSPFHASIFGGKSFGQSEANDQDSNSEPFDVSGTDIIEGHIVDNSGDGNSELADSDSVDKP